MCRKKQNMPTYRPNITANADVQAIKQEMRIKIWSIIARNNSEVLTDPLTKPLKNSMPYLQSDEAPMNDDVADIKPTLDEILPLPEQKPATTNPEKPSTDKPKQSKKKRAADLLADDNTSSDGDQMTIDDAISEADGNPPRKPEAQAPAQEQSTQQENATPVQAQSTPQPQESTNSDTETVPAKRTLSDVFQAFFDWFKDRAERKDYFKALELQIYNLNAACYELLEFLDEI